MYLFMFAQRFSTNPCSCHLHKAKRSRHLRRLEVVARHSAQKFKVIRDVINRVAKTLARILETSCCNANFKKSYKSGFR